MSTPPLPMLLETWIKSNSHVLMSRMASMHWCHLNLLLLMPVMFSSTRWTALARSLLLRNRAFPGTSGRRKNIANDQATVRAPNMR